MSGIIKKIKIIFLNSTFEILIIGNFINGLGVLILGFLIWFAFSIMTGIKTGLGKPASTEYALMVIGFSLMFLGPLVFWIAVPIKNRLTKRRKKKRNSSRV